jgi:Na+/H+ antiporter NhaB
MNTTSDYTFGLLDLGSISAVSLLFSLVIAALYALIKVLDVLTSLVHITVGIAHLEHRVGKRHFVHKASEPNIPRDQQSLPRPGVHSRRLSRPG